MKIKFEAIFGNGYYFNLRRIHANVYKADVLHKIDAGWTIEEDVKVHLDAKSFQSGEKIIHGLATEQQISEGTISGMIERFPEAFINE